MTRYLHLPATTYSDTIVRPPCPNRSTNSRARYGNSSPRPRTETARMAFISAYDERAENAGHLFLGKGGRVREQRYRR